MIGPSHKFLWLAFMENGNSQSDLMRFSNVASTFGDLNKPDFGAISQTVITGVILLSSVQTTIASVSDP